jgi:hypothetical protein
MMHVCNVCFFESKSIDDISSIVSAHLLNNKKEGEVCDVEYKPISYIDENDDSCICYTVMVKHYIEGKDDK